MLIMRFLNFRDRQRVMEAAREMKTVMYQQHKVMFFSDFSTEVLKQRKQFDGVKQHLQSLNIDYRFSYPAKLTVTHRGQKKTCSTPEEVEKFIEKNNESDRQHGDMEQ